MSPLNRIVQSSSTCTCFTMSDCPSITTRSKADPDLPSVVPNGSRLVAPASSSSTDESTGRGVVGSVVATSTIMAGRLHLRENRRAPPATAPDVVGGDAVGDRVDREHVDVVTGVGDTVLLPGHGVFDDLAGGSRMTDELLEGARLPEPFGELVADGLRAVDGEAPAGHRGIEDGVG